MDLLNHYLRSSIVYTIDDKEYKGWIKRISIEKDKKRELCLFDHKLVKRDYKGYQLDQNRRRNPVYRIQHKKILRLKT